MKATERRQALLEHLCEVRQSTLENLAFEFSVSISTIRRDVLELSLSYPVYTVCGKYDGGVYIANDYFLGKQYLSEKQRNVLESLLPTVDDDQRKVLLSIVSKFGRPSKQNNGGKFE